MKKNRLIFFAIFGLFQLGIFLFSYYIKASQQNFSDLLQILKSINWIVVGSLLGIILLITEIIWVSVTEKNHKKEAQKLTQELNLLKAKLFDLQEAANNSANIRPETTPRKPL